MVLLAVTILPPTANCRKVCSKSDIDSRRPADQGIGITIDPRKLVECDELDLSILRSDDAGNKLKAEGAMELAKYLKVNLRLTRLKLTGNIIGDEGIGYVAEALRYNDVLESLWIGRNNISDTGISTLTQVVVVDERCQT